MLGLKKLVHAFNGRVPLQYFNKTTDQFEVQEGSNGAANVLLAGSHIRLSTEPKPTDGVKDGDDLLLVDTKEVYIFYKGTWYLQ
jgi:hypothetical protein